MEISWRLKNSDLEEKLSIIGMGFNQNQYRVDSFEEEMIGQRKIFGNAVD